MITRQTRACPYSVTAKTLMFTMSETSIQPSLTLKKFFFSNLATLSKLGVQIIDLPSS